jgi:Divergent InlB B-repeat domain
MPSDAKQPNGLALKVKGDLQGRTVNVARLGPPGRDHRPDAPPALPRDHNVAATADAQASDAAIGPAPQPSSQRTVTPDGGTQTAGAGQTPAQPGELRIGMGAVDAPSAAAGSVPAATVIVIDSDPDDFIGQGIQTTIPGSSVQVGTLTGGGPTPSTPNDVWIGWTPDPFVSDLYWLTEFAAPPGQALTVGSYSNAVRVISRTAGVPGMDVSGRNRGCNSLGGSFTIEEISVDGNGNLLAFAATFKQSCSSGWLYGEVRYNSTVGYASKTLAPTAIAFGSVPVSPPAAPRTVVVTSTGSLPLVITKSSFTTNPSPSSFQVTGGTCVSNAADVTVNPGAACSFAVTTTTNPVVTPTATMLFADNSARTGGRVPTTATFTGAATISTWVSSLSSGASSGGSVDSNPAGIHCSKQEGILGVNGTCSMQVLPGTSVTLTQTPGPHSSFTGWGDPLCPGLGACTFTAAAGSTGFSATFDLHRVSVSFTDVGDGTVQTDPSSSLNCVAPGGNGCLLTVDPGTSVTLVATPAANSTFAGWGGGTCSGTSNCTFTPAAGQTSVTAAFQTATVQVGNIGQGNGTVTSNPAGISCTGPGATGTCIAKFKPGSSVTLTAAAGANSAFAGFSMDCTGASPCTFYPHIGLNGVNADFQTPRVIVQGSGGGFGSLVSSPAGINCAYARGGCSGPDSVVVPIGSSVTITATSSPGSLFAGWTGPCSGTGPCTFAAGLGDTEVGGRFELVGPALGQLSGTAFMAVPTTFAGKADVTGGGCGTLVPCVEPPDPWVAVGPSHIVQTTNLSIRVSSRTGTLLKEVSLPSFFLEPPGELLGGDPRIVWDSLHSRWIGIEMSANCDGGLLYLAVSNTADPTSTWTVYAFAAPGMLMDYPALGLSSDKVAVSFNLYDLNCIGGFNIAGFRGADFIAVDAATLIAHPAELPFVERGWSPSLFTFRPALALTAGNDLPMIVGTAGDGVLDVGYTRLTGTISGGGMSSDPITDLTTDAGVPPFSDPPTPMAFSSPGAPPIDGRPTDAIVQNGKLWFVSTIGCVPTGDTRTRSCFRLTQLAAGAIPTVLQDFVIGRSGYDEFTAGIGLSGSRSLGVVWSESSGSSAGSISTVASYRLDGDTPGRLRLATTVTAGAGTYLGARWGDFVGVAQDPADARALWEADELSTSAGDWRTQVAKLSINPGPVGTVSVNAGAANSTSSNVTLTLSVTDDLGPVTTVFVSNSPTMSGATSVANAATVLWTLAAGDGSRTAYVQWQDSLGNRSAVASDSIVVDQLAPSITSAPAASVVTSSTIGSSASVRVAWVGTDAASGIAKYEVGLSTNSGSFVLVSSPTSSSYTRSLTFSSTTTYRFRVRAIDKVGHASAYSYGQTFHVKLIQQSSTSVHYNAAWSLGSTTSASGGSYRYTSTAGRYTYYTFTGRTIAVVAYRSSGSGSFKVYIDGVYKTTVSLYITTATQWKRVVYSLNVPSGTHTIKLVAVGTSGHPRINLDAFIVLG